MQCGNASLQVTLLFTKYKRLLLLNENNGQIIFSDPI